jgi:dipeptidyl aminopeptidase/acylaminoacyl peptidase
VNVSETVTFVQMLRRANKPFELLIFPDEVHDFLRHRNWLTAYRTTEEFFERTLKRGERVAVH